MSQLSTAEFSMETAPLTQAETEIKMDTPAADNSQRELAPEQPDSLATKENGLLDIIQLESGARVRVDHTRDAHLTTFGKNTLKDRYLLPNESYQDLFARVATAYADDSEHAQRMYDYISKLWFMPSTPVLSNGSTNRGLPISCFLNEVDDSLEGLVKTWTENIWLAARGGGIGCYYGNIRSIGEQVGEVGKTSGIMPFIKVTDSLTLAISQGSLRRGSAAVYLPIDHPEIEEFIEIRRPTGGDPNRRSLNLHHGVAITDDFMKAVENDEEWPLRSPKTGAILSSINARALWVRLLTARVETGEPYLLFIDHVNRALPEQHKLAGLSVKTSNLCCEITLPTGIDHRNQERTAVCCLSSVNLEKYLEWEQHPGFIEDCMRFLDNVLSDFIERAPDSMHKASYAAMRERSVGLGVMGFHSFLQSQGVPFESVMAKVWNTRMFKHIRKEADQASITLADERGPCPDAAEYGIHERFSNKMAIAPTASISIICGGASPGIEPTAANVYTHKTLSGSCPVRNPHLAKVLTQKGKNNDETWSSIAINGGSVQHLDFLSQTEKDIFKTAFEIDQRWVIEHTADRTPFICQSQSVNIFLPANVHKKTLHEIHWQAWKKGVKSLYYCRSLSAQRAESHQAENKKSGASSDSTPQTTASSSTGNNTEECLACQ